jgi:hypothetical protein
MVMVWSDNQGTGVEEEKLLERAGIGKIDTEVVGYYGQYVKEITLCGRIVVVYHISPVTNSSED